MTIRWIGIYQNVFNFNSHPHKEDDGQEALDIMTTENISTHILTRRMTSPDFMPSTRILYFNSHPHKEDDASSSSTFCTL